MTVIFSSVVDPLDFHASMTASSVHRPDERSGLWSVLKLDWADSGRYLHLVVEDVNNPNDYPEHECFCHDERKTPT